MYKLIVLLLTVLEGFITYITFFKEDLAFTKFVILHILVIVVFFFLNQFYKRNTYIYGKLVFTIPFIGILLYFIEIVFIKKNDFDIVEDVFNFEKFVEGRQELEEVDMKKELKLLSARDTLELENESEKKDLIINFDSNDIKSKIKILRKGLLDDDIEVVHYSAIEFNQLSEKFDKKLRKLKKRYFETEEKEDFITLMEFYKDYLNSSILEGSILDIHRKFYIDLLKSRLKIENSVEYFIEILNMYLLLKEYETVKEKCYEFLKKDIKNPKIYELLIIAYYKSNNLTKIKEIYSLSKKENIEISKEVQNIFKICGLEG